VEQQRPSKSKTASSSLAEGTILKEHMNVNISNAILIQESVVKFLVSSHLSKSNAAARRMLDQNAVKVFRDDEWIILSSKKVDFNDSSTFLRFGDVVRYGKNVFVKITTLPKFMRFEFEDASVS
jgi:tyrosyl-tRNA synthetase